MIYTTLKRIRDAGPCQEGWAKLLKSLDKTKADDKPLPLTRIISSNGIDDALWCLRTINSYDAVWRLFAVWSCRQVQHLMTDERSLIALDITEQYANGEASLAELKTASAAASAAADAASAVASAAAAYAAADAASAAASADAASAAASAAAYAAAYDDAYHDVTNKQAFELKRICEENDNLADIEQGD